MQDKVGQNIINTLTMHESRESCRGSGLTMASTCTMFKSYCCVDKQTCGGSSSSLVSYYHNPRYPREEAEPVATCSSRIVIQPGNCLVR